MTNIWYILQIAQYRNRPITLHDPDKVWVDIHLPGWTVSCIHNVLSINDAGFVAWCKDKSLQYCLFWAYMPKMHTYIDPTYIEKKKHIHTNQVFTSVEHIINDIETQYTFPCIIKRWKWTLWRNVFLCQKRSDVENAISTILADTKLYDYLILAQEYIHFEIEYRLIIVHNRLELVYKKQYFWDKSIKHNRTIIEPSDDIFIQLQEFIKSLTNHLTFTWAGLDVVVDNNGKFYLIECNANPQFHSFVKHNSIEPLYNLYYKAFQAYI